MSIDANIQIITDLAAPSVYGAKGLGLRDNIVTGIVTISYGALH